MTREEMMIELEKKNEIVNDYNKMTLDEFCDKYECFECFAKDIYENAKREVRSLESGIEEYDDEEERINNPYNYYGVSVGMF